MKRNDIAKKLLNNLLFKYDKTCDIRAFYVDRYNSENHPVYSFVVGSLITDEFNENFTVDINTDTELFADLSAENLGWSKGKRRRFILELVF